MPFSILEKLSLVHPNMEIWWDSSPLVFKGWVKEMVDAAPPAKKDALEEQLNRIYVSKNPAQSLIRGCTTNPPLSLIAMKSDVPFWNDWIDNLILSNMGLSQHEYYWLTYRETIRLGAEMMLPIWEASNGKYGYISGQLDPRINTDVEKMLAMAKEMAAIAPNVMVKVAATMQGVEVVRQLTAWGIPTNVTTCFTLPQIWAVAHAAREGQAIAEKNGVDMSKWRAVITMMIGRLIEHPVLDQQASRRNIALSWADKHWLGIYIFRKAFKLLQDNALPSKLLACSMREGPNVGGKMHFWDIEKIAGDIVYTMPPLILKPFFQHGEDLNFKEELLYADVPQDVLHKASHLPYILQAWNENGMEVDQFNTHPAVVATSEAFANAATHMEAFIGMRQNLIEHSKHARQMAA